MTGKKLMAAERRDEQGYVEGSNSVELKIGHTYFVHSVNPNPEDDSPSFFLAMVKEIYSTQAEFETAIPTHIKRTSAAWGAWGNREKKKEEANTFTENEKKNMDALMDYWRANNDENDSAERRFRVVRIVWYERRSIEARNGRDAINVSFWGPWYPHHITGKYQYEGLVGNDAFVAMVKTTSSGTFLQIPKAEQAKLKSLPSRGALFIRELAKFSEHMNLDVPICPDQSSSKRSRKRKTITVPKVNKEKKLSEEIDIDAPLGPNPSLSSNIPPSARRMSTRTRKVTRKKEVVTDSEDDSVDDMSTESEPYVSSDESSGKQAIDNITSAFNYANNYLPFKIYQSPTHNAAKKRST